MEASRRGLGAAIRFSVLALALAATPARAAASVVLFDEAHGQPFTVGKEGDLQLSALAGLIRGERGEVRPSRAALDEATLARADALVISGAFAPLSAAEREAVRRFLERGGRLAVMIHIGDPLKGLLGDLGVLFSRGPIHEREQLLDATGLNFSVNRFAPHPLTEGLRSLSVFGCWALIPKGPASAVLAQTGFHAWLDTNHDQSFTQGEPMERQGVLVAGTVGRGEYAVFGDDAIFQNRFLAAHNIEAGRRLARWLARGRAEAPRPGVTDL